MRVEYKIKDRRILKKAFGNAFVTCLTDDKITKLFKQYFERDIVFRYHQWAAENQKQLLEAVKQQKQQGQKWVSGFLRYCRQYEAVNGLPLLFDIKDMLPIFKQMYPNAKTARHKYDRFRRQAFTESDLMGHTAKIQEIIEKIGIM